MTDFRIGIGRFWHESNSFSPVTTSADDFRAPSSYGGVAVGPEVLEQGTRRDEVTGFIEVFGADNRFEMFPLLSAGTLPSGLVTPDAVTLLEDTLRRQLRQAGHLDGICFALHGAMSGTGIDDLDGYFLQVIRHEVGPDVPIICPLDCHAVVTDQMIDLTTAMTAYRTHPHTDLVETGHRAAQMLTDVLQGRTRPFVHYRRLPMLFSDPGIDRGPFGEVFDTMTAWDEIEGVISCSLCPAFPYQDVPEQGWTALAVTDDDEALAHRLASELSERAWAVRRELLPDPGIPPHDAIRKAIAVDGCPVVITDAADNIGGGTPGDTTTMLSALLEMRHQVEGLILAHLPDPQAVAQTRASKAGDVVQIEVGGKRDTYFSKPLPLEARVECLTEGHINNDGKFGSDATIDIGKAVCLAVDNLRLVLTERLIMGPQPSLFRKVGIEPYEAKIVMLKSGTGYKATYGHVAKAVIRADCPGAMSYNIHNFDFKRIQRPMYPLDVDIQWRPD